jgi:hypothetical protein
MKEAANLRGGLSSVSKGAPLGIFPVVTPLPSPAKQRNHRGGSRFNSNRQRGLRSIRPAAAAAARDALLQGVRWRGLVVIPGTKGDDAFAGFGRGQIALCAWSIEPDPNRV